MNAQLYTNDTWNLKWTPIILQRMAFSTDVLWTELKLHSLLSLIWELTDGDCMYVPPPSSENYNREPCVLWKGTFVSDQHIPSIPISNTSGFVNIRVLLMMLLNPISFKSKLKNVFPSCLNPACISVVHCMEGFIANVNSPSIQLCDSLSVSLSKGPHNTLFEFPTPLHPLCLIESSDAFYLEEGREHPMSFMKDRSNSRCIEQWDIARLVGQLQRDVGSPSSRSSEKSQNEMKSKKTRRGKRAGRKRRKIADNPSKTNIGLNSNKSDCDLQSSRTLKTHFTY